MQGWPVILEACVESLAEARDAEQKGAHRLELCADLVADGLTPSSGLVREVIHSVHIPVNVMIRPRGGNFMFSDSEIAQMLIAIRMLKDEGVNGFVSGSLQSDLRLNLPQIRVLAEAAHPVSLTIHKCIDLVPDVFEAIDVLKKIPGVRGVLSSGQHVTALEGAQLLRRMVAVSGKELTVVVAGKVTPQNLDSLITLTGAHEFHGRKIV